MFWWNLLSYGSIVGAFVFPWLALEAAKAVKNGERTLPYALSLGLCSGLVFLALIYYR